MSDPKGVPLALWASTTCPENATAIPFDLGALTSPFRTVFAIDCISMMVSLGAAVVTGVQNLGQTIRLRFTLGHLGISQDWTPMWSYAPRMQSALTKLFAGPIGTLEAINGAPGTFVGGQTVSYASFLWRLPKPLYVAPGMTLHPSVQRGVDGAGGSATIEMAYLGRRMPDGFKMPAEIDVPYVARFLPPEIVTAAPSPIQATDPTFVQSQDRADLTNPFDVPIRVQRLIYRSQVRPGSNTMEMFENDPTLISILASNNRKLVDSLAANVVFDRVRSAWKVSFDLLPGENITLQIPKATRLTPNGGAASPAQYTFAMVGSRRERL